MRKALVVTLFWTLILGSGASASSSYESANFEYVLEIVKLLLFGAFIGISILIVLEYYDWGNHGLEKAIRLGYGALPEYFNEKVKENGMPVTRDLGGFAFFFSIGGWIFSSVNLFFSGLTGGGIQLMHIPVFSIWGFDVLSSLVLATSTFVALYIVPNVVDEDVFWAQMENNRNGKGSESEYVKRQLKKRGERGGLRENEVFHVMDNYFSDEAEKSPPSGNKETKNSDNAVVVQGLQSLFRKEELIGRGGMANVHFATQLDTGDVVAWKEAAASRFNSLKEVNERISSESEALRGLSHIRIPKHIEYGEVDNEMQERVGVMITEYVEGTSLSDEVKMLSSRGKVLDSAEAAKIVEEVCEALEYMADLEPPMYHRDVKPSNIISNPDRGSVLIDFGFAKEVLTGSDLSISRGASEGWSPPERRDGVSGPFTDVFSLGQILWHLLTGERPFHALSKQELQSRIVEKDHPEWLADLIHASVQRKDRRIQTVAEFRARLQNRGEVS